MKTYLTLLCGINVSGQKKITMNELKRLFESLNYENIKTYIQSGNVVFSQDEIKEEEHVRLVEKKIAEKYGFEVTALLRSYPELVEIVECNPFINQRGISMDKLHVTFLAATPQPDYHDKIKDFVYDSDQFILSGKEIYVYCPDGYGKTKLNNAFFEKKLHVKATTRNWKTINELLNKMKSVQS